MALADDPQARAALQHALALTGAALVGYEGEIPYEGPPLDDAELMALASAEVAACALAALDRAGGDSAALLRKMYLYVAGGRTEGAGHG